MERFVNTFGLADFTNIIDPDGGLWSTFGFPYQPAFVPINDNGEITPLQGASGPQGILDAANKLAST